MNILNLENLLSQQPILLFSGGIEALKNRSLEHKYFQNFPDTRLLVIWVRGYGKHWNNGMHGGLGVFFTPQNPW